MPPPPLQINVNDKQPISRSASNKSLDPSGGGGNNTNTNTTTVMPGPTINRTPSAKDLSFNNSVPQPLTRTPSKEVPSPLQNTLLPTEFSNVTAIPQPLEAKLAEKLAAIRRQQFLKNKQNIRVQTISANDLTKKFQSLRLKKKDLSQVSAGVKHKPLFFSFFARE